MRLRCERWSMELPRWVVLSTILTYISKYGVRAEMAEWGTWGSWSECSRTCGMGVTHRTRQCKLPHGSSSSVKSTCVGQYKDFSTCNPNECSKGSKEFRAVQCSAYDNKNVRGRIYRWDPYYRDRDQCVLACRAKVYRFYAKLSEKVTDGTRCDPNDPYHICVNGKCQRVGCDGVLGSEKSVDKCGVCGGNSTSCHIISGIFTRRSLPYGYNKVTTIPVGACNLNISEMQPSGNYLALKLTNGGYVLNGNWALGYSNDYQGAGAVFQYHRPLPRDSVNPLEYITAKGPTNESLEIMLLKQQDNRGILYSYTIPMDKYMNSKGREDPYIRHASTPVTPRYISRDEYANQVAAQGSGADQRLTEAGDVREAVDAKNQPQSDETGVMYKERYQAYLTRLRQRERQQRPVYPIDDRGTSLSESKHRERHERPGYPIDNSGTTVSQSRQGAQAPARDDYETRLRAHRLRQREHERSARERLARQEQQQQQRQKQQQQQQQQQQEARNSRDRSGSHTQTGSQVSQSYPQTRPRTGSQLREPNSASQPQAGAQTAPKPGINYGITGQTAPKPGINYGVSPSQAQPGPKPGINFGVPPNPNLVPNARSPAQPYVPQPPYQQPGSYHNPNPAYPQQPPIQQQPYPAVQNKYQPPYQQPYNPSYRGQYQGGLGQVQQQRQAGHNQYLGGAVNDQIVLTLPGSNRPPQLGIVDWTADYSWKITAFTECSRQCGEGEQSTVIVCVRVASQAIVTNENCNNAIKPQTQSIPCNTHTCPPAWEIGEWSACSTSCDRGQQTRTTECKQRVSKAVQLSVSASRCPHASKASIIKGCNEDKPCLRWKHGDWSTCSTECGRGQRTRQVTCVNADDQVISENLCTGHRPRSTQMCDMGSCAKTWFYTAWATECSSDCGHGVFTRDLYCSADSQRCRAIDKPDHEKACRSDIPCGGKWFTGPWGKCTVTCGDGVTRRDITCIKRLGKLMVIVDEENCLSHDKPDSEKPCERAACRPQWYITDWTECSKSCGTGFKTREVKCLSENKRPTNVCDQSLKPEGRKICKILRCPKSRTEPGCIDKFKNCLLVVQARLCNYDYYKNNCCLSCTSHEHHHHHDNT